MLKRLFTTVALVSMCSGLTLAAEKRVILPKGAEPNAGWSYGILIDGTLYVSGMAGEDAAGKIPDTFEAEVKQSLDNINAVLKEAGMTPADVVSMQVYITDGALFDRMNTTYKAGLHKSQTGPDHGRGFQARGTRACGDYRDGKEVDVRQSRRACRVPG